MSERPFRHLCPEADLRDAMSDDEFWTHVAKNLGHDMDDPDDYDGPELDEAIGESSCPVCGSGGACGYDADGRALIHATEADE